jgi:hypothetical protein
MRTFGNGGSKVSTDLWKQRITQPASLIVAVVMMDSALVSALEQNTSLLSNLR